MTDLEADVDDLADEEWEDEDIAEGPSPALEPTTSMHGFNGSIRKEEEFFLDQEGEALASATSKLLSIHEPDPQPPASSSLLEPPIGSDPPLDLLYRRGARKITPPIPPAQEPPTARTTSGQIEYLRPITPTQPLMGNHDIYESVIRTPTTHMLANDGPMTPTNNAGPFVFDGSAGRAGSRVEPSRSEASAEG